MDRKAYTVVRTVTYVEIVTTDIMNDDKAQEEILALVKNHKTDGSTFKCVSVVDRIGQVLDVNV